VPQHVKVYRRLYLGSLRPLLVRRAPDATVTPHSFTELIIPIASKKNIHRLRCEPCNCELPPRRGRRRAALLRRPRKPPTRKMLTWLC